MKKIRDSLAKNYKDDCEHYLAYHNDQINYLIHMITIPFEWYGFILCCGFFHLHLIVSFLTGIIHLFLKRKLGYFVAFIHFLFGISSEVLFRTKKVSSFSLLLIGVALQIIAWSLQVLIGHWYLEKNSPAITQKFSVTSVIFSVMLSWDINARNRMKLK
jgi:uncharacterized membrane protein YGL010W